MSQVTTLLNTLQTRITSNDPEVNFLSSESNPVRLMLEIYILLLNLKKVHKIMRIRIDQIIKANGKMIGLIMSRIQDINDMFLMLEDTTFDNRPVINKAAHTDFLPLFDHPIVS